MAIIKSPKQQLWALRRENATLRAELARQRELTAFVALAAVGLDLEALTAEEEADDGAV
ncbi:MAG: hypothetical protein IKP82_02095 [Oscillospiraceae bacterium]|nr:hypothetical protein [Oscillospiraceae bacterium]